MSADRNLLFGILALQIDFISKDALIQAMGAWVLDKAKPLGQILVDQGALTAGRYSLLEALVQEHLAHHGNDLSRSLATVPPARSVREELERITDPDLHASLAHCNGTPSLGEDPNATKDPSIGTLTSSGLRFRIVRAHAKGGLGEVFVAVDEELHREVALKEIQQKYADHVESRTRFVREAEITGGLEHPGVVPVYGKGEYPGGRPFYAMRFIRGQSLQAAIDRFHKAEGPGRDPGERTLELRQLLSRFVAMCNAVAYAHSRGVIHRDLKPANVMLGNYGETLVVDWGLAKLIDHPEKVADAAEPPLVVGSAEDSELTQMGAAMGTPAFMSPEQAAGRLDLISPASDVYSLGATLYCLLTGSTPFSSTDLGVMLANVQRGEFPPPRQKNPQLPTGLEAICLKSMALKPADRYTSAKALADDIEHWLADEPVTAYAEPWQGRLGRWVRQHKGWVGSAAATVLVMVTVGVAWGLVAAAAARETQEQMLRSQAEKQREEAEKQRGLAETKQLEADKQRRLAEEQRGVVRRLLYLSRINMADRAWHDNLIPRMEELLQEYQQPQPGQEEPRGFEWHYLWRLCHSCLLNCQGHTAGVISAAFSPDGRRLASGSEDGTVKVWDATTGQEAFTLKGHDNGVNSLAYSPDSRRLASAAKDQALKLWDLASGQETLTLKMQISPVNSMAFSPDSKRLASVNWDDTIEVWDVTTGQRAFSVKRRHAGTVLSVIFSPDGLRLVSAAKDGTLKVWDATTGQEALALKLHTDDVNSVCFSPDGLRLASASSDGTVRVWDATTGQEALVLKGNSAQVSSLAFSPNGRLLASALADKTMKVWDAITGQEALSYKGHSENATSVAFSPDGLRLASASLDKTVRVWDATGSQEVLSLKRHIVPVNSVAFSPDGRRLASAGYDGVKVLDTTTGSEVLTVKGYTGWISGLAFGPDGLRVASTAKDGTVRVWDATTGQETLSVKGHSAQVTFVALSSDGRRLASVSNDGTAKVWDVTTSQEVLSIKGHTDKVRTYSVNSVAFSPDGRRLASVSFENTVKVWDTTTGQEALCLQGHTAEVLSVIFSPDGRHLASASEDKTVKVWDATTGQEVLSLKGHTFTICSMAFSPDGRLLACACGNRLFPSMSNSRPSPLQVSGEVKVWDAITGKEALSLLGHTGLIYSLAFNPDGRRLAGASDDGTVKVWEAGPTPPEVLLESQAVFLVESLYLKLIKKAQVIRHLRGDPSLGDALRQKAMTWAEQIQPTPEQFNNASWEVVRQPRAPATAYRQALVQAEEACRLVPGNGSYLNTLGVAQYRAGQYTQALESLTQSDKLNAAAWHRSLLEDLAFLAMTQHRLGHHEQARAALEQLQQGVKEGRLFQSEESTGFLAEAEALIWGRQETPKTIPKIP